MRALVDRYRCPECFLHFAVVGDVSSISGFYRFGKDTIVYGPSSAGTPAATITNGLTDLSTHVNSQGPIVGLPFDPSGIVNNLRLERYTANGYLGKESVLSSDAIRRAYYLLRPLLSVSVRKHLQRLFLRDWEALNFPTWPVDTTVESLFEMFLLLSMKTQGIEKLPFIWFWPDGASSCVIVTHDVETKAGAAFVPRLMDLDDEFDIKSSFQVVPQKQYPVSKGFLNEIKSRGFELNVQDLNHDGNLFDNREKFFKRAQAINRYVREYEAHGFRAGRMYRNADWLDALEISYDMSIPNVAHLDAQRGGCCTVFPYFIGRILELPVTTIQDYSLFHILNTYSPELWKTQIGIIRKKHGLASFIIHPDYIVNTKAQDVYRALLTHLTVSRDQERVWIPLPEDVNRWWRERNQMNLVQDGNSWRIEGQGKERARLAYARLDGDRVIYEVDERK